MEKRKNNYLCLVGLYKHLEILTLQLPDQISHSPYCQPYNPYNVSSENLVLDQLIIPKLIFFFILITYLVDIALMLLGEILSWSLVVVRGLRAFVNSTKQLLLATPEWDLRWSGRERVFSTPQLTARSWIYWLVKAG